MSWKAITRGPPLVIAPYNESVGLASFDSKNLHIPFQMRVLKALTFIEKFERMEDDKFDRSAVIHALCPWRVGKNLLNC